MNSTNEILSLENFKKYIDLILKHRDLQDEFCNTLEKLAPGEYCNCFLYTKYEEAVIDLLKIAMGLSDNDDIIEYWLYELECGKNSMAKDYKLETIEDLYNQIAESKK